MSLSIWILSLGFVGLAALSVPIAFAIVVCVIAVLWVSDISPTLLPQMMIAGTQSFSLLGVPFFMLAGELMTAGGLSRRLIGVADVFVRHLPGGMGLVVIVAAVMFAAISGSAPATTAAVGVIMVPAMVERGYSRPYAAALCVSAGIIAPLIPPSIAFILWGVIAEQSIIQLFLSGVFPGLALAGCLCVYVFINGMRNPIQLEKRATSEEILLALRKGVWSLLAPVLILGGIYSGAFTPTEASAVACLYALIVGLFVERELKVCDLPAVIIRAMKIAAIVMTIVAASSAFSVLVAHEQLAQKVATGLYAMFSEWWAILIPINLVFFVLGALMDEVAIVLIFGPLLIEIANTYGIDPIHFGAIIVTNAAIGMATPPIGYCLFVGMAVSAVSMGKITRAIWPQIAIMCVVLILVTYIPAGESLLNF